MFTLITLRREPGWPEPEATWGRVATSEGVKSANLHPLQARNLGRHWRNILDPRALPPKSRALAQQLWEKLPHFVLFKGAAGGESG